MDTTLLSKVDLLALMDNERSRDITGQVEALYPDGVIDIWPYVRAVPMAELSGFKLAGGDLVEYVYRNASSTFDLVHVMTTRKNVYLVIAIDVLQDRIKGHHLLDLNKDYGLDAANDA